MNKTITFSTSLSHICYATWMKSESLLCLANLLLFLDFLWQLMEPSPCKASKPKSKSVLYLWRTSSALDKTEQLAQTVIKQNNMWSNHFQSLDHRQHKTNLWEKESSQGELSVGGQFLYPGTVGWSWSSAQVHWHSSPIWMEKMS